MLNTVTVWESWMSDLQQLLPWLQKFLPPPLPWLHVLTAASPPCAIRKSYAAMQPMLLESLPMLLTTEKIVDFSFNEVSVHCGGAQTLFPLCMRRAETAFVCNWTGLERYKDFMELRCQEHVLSCYQLFLCNLFLSLVGDFTCWEGKIT